MNSSITDAAPSALRAVRELVLPGESDGSEYELVIRTDTSGLSVRDMAAFLGLLDHVYGRLQPEGFRSYVMRTREHLRIAEVQSGSLLLAIREVLESTSPLLVAYLCLKYLPSALESITSAMDSVEQARLARVNRERIRMQMEKDATLEPLPPPQKEELAGVVETVLRSDGDLVVRAYRFREERVVEICVRRPE